MDDSGEIDMFYCDCPHDADVCKHIVAVFYELKNRVKMIKLKPVKEPRRRGFEDILKNLTEAELKAFIVFYARNDMTSGSSLRYISLKQISIEDFNSSQA